MLIPWAHPDPRARYPVEGTITFAVKTSGQMAQLPTGTYQLDVIATAANAPFAVKRLVFNIPAEWSDDDRIMAREIGLRVIGSFPR